MILDDIVAHKKIEVERLKTYTPLDRLMNKIEQAKPIRDFAAALAQREGVGGIRIIAEVKKASPSKGIIREGYFYPYEIARLYQIAGAAAISVVTEEKFFQGSLDFLVPIKAHLKLPVLRKDFIFDDYQIYESRAAGADAVLLIVAMLTPARLTELMALISSLGMASLVEVHDEEEMKIALDAGARIIGVNNRDLKTFKTDIATTVRLAPLVPEDKILVSESGINTFDDVAVLRKSGVNAFLVGEALMREKDPGVKLKELRGLK